MKTLYADCSRGITKGAFLGALVGLINDNSVIDTINGFLPQNYTLSSDYVDLSQNIAVKAQLTAPCTEHSHHHGTSLSEVYEIIDNSAFSAQAKTDAKGIFDVLAKAEAAVHGYTVDTVHFHEVGSEASVYYTLCIAALTAAVAADEIVFSPVNTGCGKVTCAHGELDIPAPAAAATLNDVPHFSDGTTGELCTPSGAAVAKYYAARFSPLQYFPTPHRIGIGLGFSGDSVRLLTDF